MGRNARHSGFGRVLPQHLPDDLLAQALAGNGARAAHRPEYETGGNFGGRGPRIYCRFHPRWHWRCPNATMLADQIDNAPAAVALLNVRER